MTAKMLALAKNDHQDTKMTYNGNFIFFTLLSFFHQVYFMSLGFLH